MLQPSTGSDVREGTTTIGFAAAGVTDIGLVRDENQDAYHASEQLGVMVVSDGMGGAPEGAVASRLAVRVAADLLCEAAMEAWADHGVMAARATLRQAVVSAHNEIVEYGRSHPEAAGLGATITAFMGDHVTGTYAIGHVGDSRAYLLRRGVLRQLTRDDTLLQEQVEQGRVPYEMARSHPFGHILSQVLGMDQPISPQILDGTLELGDQLFLCSDGVTAVLNDREIGEMLVRGRLWPPDTVVRAFVESVNERGGPDNATAVLLRRI